MTKFQKFLLEQSKERTEKGTYVAVKFSSASNEILHQYAKSLGFLTFEFHATVAFSRVQFNYSSSTPVNGVYAKIKRFNKFGENNEALVLELDCPFLDELHDKIMKDNPQATYDFSEYIPHVSLTYSAQDFDIPSEVPTFELEIVEIYSEDLEI